jgi:hypothetical protein
MLEKTVWRPSRHESKLYWQVEESEHWKGEVSSPSKEAQEG